MPKWTWFGRGKKGSVTSMETDPDPVVGGSGSTVDLDLYQDSSGFIQIDDEKEHRWGQDGSSLGRSKSSAGTRSRSHSHQMSHSQDKNQSDHVFYVDMDLVTDSETRVVRTETKGGFELERWWLLSDLWQRLIPFLLFMFLLVGLAHLAFGLYCFSQVPREWEDVNDPYVCNTTDCQTLSVNLADCINPAANPCVDFYEYACGRWLNQDESPDAVPTEVIITDAFMTFAEGAFLSKILKLQGDKTDKFVDFFKACIDLRSREKVGIDPILRIIRHMIPSSFLHSGTFKDLDYLKEGIAWGAFFGETGFLLFYPLPNRRIALTRPEWARDQMPTFERLLRTRRAEYEADIQAFFEKVWKRMKELGLITVEPYSASEAAQLILVIINSLLDIFDPDVPVPALNPAEITTGRRKLDILMQGVFDKVIDPKLKLSFTVVTSNVAEEKHAFGVWNGNPVGSWITFTAPSQKLKQDLTTNRKVPLPATQVFPELYKALHAFRIYLLFFRYAGDFPIKHWTEYGLEKVFPGHAKQEDQRLLKVESYCLSRTVYYLNAFTKLRLLKVMDEERLDKMREGMDALQAHTKQSLRRWYTLRERAGDLDPLLDRITDEFISIYQKITVEFPLPEPTPEALEIMQRQAAYLDDWVVDPQNYLETVHNMTGLLTRGRHRDWRKNVLKPGENHRLFLDTVRTSSSTQEAVNYANIIYFPLLLLEPPYFLNPVKVFDFAGTALFMARAILELWSDKTRDTGGLGLKPEVLAGLSSGVAGMEHEETCRAVLTEDLSGNFLTSFPNFMKNSQGLGVLAFKVAYDLFKNPEDFETYVDLETGEPFRIRILKNEHVELIGPEFYANASSAHFFYTRYPNGTWVREPVDQRRYLPLRLHRPHQLQYRSLVGMEHYTIDQIFFLHAINGLCFSRHGRGTERFDRYARLMNGVFQQLEEFAETWGCSLGDPMHPPDTCLVGRSQEHENETNA